MFHAESDQYTTRVARLVAMGRPLVAAWLLATGCVGFDDYPEADLCKNAVRDENGRPLHYPESRICPRVLAGVDAGDGGDGK